MEETEFEILLVIYKQTTVFHGIVSMRFKIYRYDLVTTIQIHALPENVIDEYRPSIYLVSKN